MPKGERVQSKMLELYIFHIRDGGGEKLTVAAHGDGVGNTNGVELPAEHSLLIDGSLDDLAEFEHCGLRISWIASFFGDAQTRGR